MNKIQDELEEQLKTDYRAGKIEQKCVVCGKMTRNEHYFGDEGTCGYLDFCCDKCYKNLLEKPI